jgi:hypothetical protein
MIRYRIIKRQIGCIIPVGRIMSHQLPAFERATAKAVGDALGIACEPWMQDGPLEMAANRLDWHVGCRWPAVLELASIWAQHYGGSL